MVTEMPVMATGAELELATVTCSGEDVVPTSTVPKLKVAGVRVSEPAGRPVPLRSTVSWPP